MVVTPKYLRLKDAAAYCNLSLSTLMKLQAKKQGPPRIKVGRAVLYSIKHLDEWLAAHTQRAA